MGGLVLSRTQRHETLMRVVVERVQGGGLPAVGYAVAWGGRTVWAVALPCGMAALLTSFQVVPWRDMVTLHEAKPGVGVHVAHTSCRHGPTHVAG